MKKLKTAGVFVLSYLVFYAFACVVFPVENDALKVPDYYVVLTGASAIGLSALYGRWQKNKKPKNIPVVPLVIRDELLDAAARVVFDTQQASVSMIQRKLRVNYTRGAELVDLLEQIGVVGPFNGKKPRKILMSKNVYERFKDQLFILATVNATTAEDELAQIDLMEGHDFEHWSADLLRDLGFTNVEVTRGSGDQGVDVLAEKEGIRYAIQCKCYHSPLGNTPIQEVHAGKEMYRCQIGAVMTNQYFTPGGKELADRTGTLLWDRDWIREAIRRRHQ